MPLMDFTAASASLRVEALNAFLVSEKRSFGLSESCAKAFTALACSENSASSAKHFDGGVIDVKCEPTISGAGHHSISSFKKVKSKLDGG